MHLASASHGCGVGLGRSDSAPAFQLSMLWRVIIYQPGQHGCPAQTALSGCDPFFSGSVPWFTVLTDRPKGDGSRGGEAGEYRSTPSAKLGSGLSPDACLRGWLRLQRTGPAVVHAARAGHMYENGYLHQPV